MEKLKKKKIENIDIGKKKKKRGKKILCFKKDKGKL